MEKRTNDPFLLNLFVLVSFSMESLYQIVLRNVPTIGYDVIHESENVNQIIDSDELVAEFLSNYIINNPHSYFVKHKLSDTDYYNVGLIHPDGTDEHGRLVFRVHLLLIKKTLYNQKSLPYWISPLFHSIEKVGTTMLSLTEDFTAIRQSISVPPKLAEHILLKTTSFYHLNLEPRKLNLLASLVDKMIPIVFNGSFTIISFSHTTDLKKKPSLVFIPSSGKNDERFNQKTDYYCQSTPFRLVNLLRESVHDESLRHRLNEAITRNKLDSEDDSRTLNLMKYRFYSGGLVDAIKYKYFELQEMIKIRKHRE